MTREIAIKHDAAVAVSGGDFASMMALADRLAESKLIPQQFRGAPEDVFLALDMAQRLTMNPLMVMQNLYIVSGKPAWSSQFIIACVNASRRYTPLRFRIKRDKDGNIVACQCVANDRATGEEITGTTITAEMVKSEGWDTKNGSKWRTMPEQMYRYRAAAFFARVNCPEITMGIYTADEVREIDESERAAQQPSAPEPVIQIEPTYEPDEKVANYARRLRGAEDKAALQAVEIEIGTDNKLHADDRDFLRPIAASMRKEFDRQ